MSMINTGLIIYIVGCIVSYIITWFHYIYQKDKVNYLDLLLALILPITLSWIMTIIILIDIATENGCDY